MKKFADFIIESRQVLELEGKKNKLKTQDGFQDEFKKVLVNMAEETPANAAGGGHIAGIGVGAKGEPGVGAMALLRHRKRTRGC